eukprot:scaffold99558_cov21-Tisochrysis_lutea.AAC.1
MGMQGRRHGHAAKPHNGCVIANMQGVRGRDPGAYQPGAEAHTHTTSQHAPIYQNHTMAASLQTCRGAAGTLESFSLEQSCPHPARDLQLPS